MQRELHRGPPLAGVAQPVLPDGRYWLMLGLARSATADEGERALKAPYPQVPDVVLGLGRGCLGREGDGVEGAQDEPTRRRVQR